MRFQHSLLHTALRACMAVLVFAVGFLPLRAEALRKVRVQLTWYPQFQFAGYYAAQYQGYYREAGLEVEFLSPTVGADPIHTVLQGRAEFGVGGPDLVQHWAKGEDVLVLAAIFQHSPLVLLARPQSGIRSIHDLRGKRVMMESQSAPLVAYLKAEGLLGQVQLLPHAFDARALARGEIDAISAFLTDEPFELRSLGQDYLVFTPQAAGIDFYGDCLYTTGALAGRDRALVERFRAASLRGWRHAMEHPQAAIDWILKTYGARHSAEHLRFEADLMRSLLQPELVELGYMNPGRWQHISRTMADLGLIQKNLPLDGFLFDPNPRSVIQRLQRLLLGTLLVTGLAAGLLLVFLRLNRRLKEQVRQRGEAEARFRNLFRHTTDAVLWLRQDPEAFRLEELNPAAERLLGRAAEVIQGLAPAGLLPGAEALEAQLGECLGKGEPQAREWTLDLGPSPRRVQALLVPLRDPHAAHVVAFLRDITQQRQDEDQQRHVQKMESLALMAGGIAHDFNNLFQATLGNLEVAQRNVAALGIPECPNLDRAMASVQQAARLSGALLDFSGKGFRSPRAVDLKALTLGLEGEFRRKLGAQRHLEVEVPEDLPLVEADPEQLREVLEALLTNADEALGEAGHLRLRAFGPPDSLEGGFWATPAPATWAGLEVADEGPGIPAELMPRIFDPFTTTKGHGRGLGLPAVLGILKAHAAGLQVLSGTGRGTRIRIFLPLHAEVPTRALPPGSSPSQGGAILVVDDEAMVRETMAELIRTLLNFPVLEARDGQEAVELMAERGREVALVLMDATMPRLGGVEAFAQIRQQWPGIPGILCSGFGDRFGQETAASHGFHSFLKKPFLLQDLKRAIELALADR